jgi:hypothetical protein
MKNITGESRYVWRNLDLIEPRLCRCTITGEESDYLYGYTENNVVDGTIRVGLALPEQLFNTKEEAYNYLEVLND